MTLEILNSEVLIPMIAGTVLLGSLIGFIAYFLFLHYKVRQKFRWEREQFKQAVLQTEIEIREQTLTQISRDLHDNLGQIASLIKINLNLISKELKEEDRQKIEDSIELLRRLIADIKSLSTSLNSETLKTFGLMEALENDAARINKTGHLNVQINLQAPLPELNPETEIFLYRMSQEIMNNTLKHAAARNLNITAEQKGKHLNLVFRDDGRGFENDTQNSISTGKGNGLNNLYKRSKMIGAEIHIISAPNRGTEIQLQVPIQMR